jgi:hypothetical protein
MKGMRTELPAIATNFEQNFSPLTKAIIAQGDAAHRLGITLRTDLVAGYVAAQKAEQDLLATGLASDKEKKDAAAAVEVAKNALDKYDGAININIQELIKQGLQLKANKEDVQLFSTAYGSAIADAITASTSIGAAIEKATEQELAALGKKAMAQAICDTGMGIAALAAWDFESASQYFEAAGVLAALGTGMSLAAGAMGGGASGGSGGSGNPGSAGHQGIQTSGSTSQGQVTTTNVQRFADGALVSKQTLAMIGDAPSGGSAREGVLPLDNPEAMRAIAGALAEHLGPMMGGNGGNHTFNMRGHFSKSEMKEIVKKVSKGVQHGTMLLRSSSRFSHIRRGSGGS